MHANNDFNNNRMYFRSKQDWGCYVKWMKLRGHTVYCGCDKNGYWVKEN
jgi:hypothetical protein